MMKRLSVLFSFLLIFTLAVSPIAEAKGSGGGHSSGGSHSSFSSSSGSSSHSYSSPSTSSRTGSFTSKGSTSSSSSTHSFSSSGSSPSSSSGTSPSTSSRTGAFSSAGKTPSSSSLGTSKSSSAAGTFKSGKVTNGQTINPVTGGTFSGGARYYTSLPSGYHPTNDFWSHNTAFAAGTMFGHMFHPYGGYYPISGGTGYVYEPPSPTWIVIDTVLKYVFCLAILAIGIFIIRKLIKRNM